MAVHLRQEAAPFKAGLLQDSSGRGVVGVSERLHFGNPQCLGRDLQAERRQLCCVTSPPGGWSEAIADLDAPTRIERVIVQAAEADDGSVRLGEHSPRTASRLSPLTFVHGKVATAFAKISEPLSVAHRIRVTEKAEKLGRVGELRLA